MAADDIADVPLPDRAAAELSALVRKQADLVLAHLAGRDGGPEVCWVCLDPGQDELVEIATVTLGRAADRTAALRGADLGDAWPQAWIPYWCRDDDEIQLARPPESTVTTHPALREALEGRVLDAGRWIAMRVAERLNRATLPLKTTDDFVVFVLHPDSDGDELIEELRFVARPDTYALLRERGLVGEPEAG